MKKLILILILVLTGTIYLNAQRRVSLNNDDINRLTTLDAVYGQGITLKYPKESYKRFWLEHWENSNQTIKWEISAENKDKYGARILVCPTKLKDGDSITLSLFCNNREDGEKESAQCRICGNSWQWITFNKEFSIAQGKSEIVLHKTDAAGSPDAGLNVYSLELFTPKTYAQKAKEAERIKADIQWMNEIPYGFFICWNSKSMPEKGEPCDYNTAAENFDTEEFAKVINECGGKLVFLTTSWAQYYFPAPLHTIDSILPGRTSERDLVADLSESLSRYGIKLILYYHAGQDDQEWWSEQSFARHRSATLFSNVEKVIGEASMRYKDKIAGFWLDDAIGYYANGASFERIDKAAKSGNKNMVICFNPWVLPKLTEFQEYYAGEADLSKKSAGVGNIYLPEGGKGFFTGGPQEGLKATYSGLFEPGNWGHIRKNAGIGSPKYTLDHLKTVIDESVKRKNLLMINVGIYRDGRISPKSQDLLKQLKQYCVEKNYYKQ